MSPKENLPLNQPTVITPNPNAVSNPNLQAESEPKNNFAASNSTDNNVLGRQSTAPPPPKKNLLSRFKGSKKLQIGSAGVVAALLTTGAVFGWYIPNKPENVYSTGLARTGDVLEQLVMESFEEDNLKAFENSRLDGSVLVKAGDSNYSADFSSTYDLKASDSSLDVKFDSKEGQEQKLNLKLLTDLPDGSYLPNVWFKLSGLRALGIDQFMPAAADYDDKWIHVSQQYLESFIPKEEGQDSTNFTHDDAKELATIATSKTSEYLLTDDEKKSVLIRKSFVGGEQSEGLNANRYKVGINKENAKKYCQELGTDFISSKAYKKLLNAGDETISQQKKQVDSTCDEMIKTVADDYTFDLWVDKKRKLVHKARFSHANDSDKYVEVGQSFKGGDMLPFFINYNDAKNKLTGRFDLETDLKQDITTGKFVSSQDGDNRYDIKINFTFRPHDGDVKVEPPPGAVPLQEVLSKLGFGDLAADQSAASVE